MRVLGKDIDSHEYLRRESELEEEDDQELPHFAIDETIATQNRSEVMAAMQMILDKRPIVVETLQLPQRDLRALHALRAAVNGRDEELSQFIYASDRRELLEQALAMLQPTIAVLAGELRDLVHRVGGLRHELKDLEDAQDELLEANQDLPRDKADADTGDKPDEARLDGPERELVKPPTSLIGPELDESPKPPSSLLGSEVADDPKPPTVYESDAEPATANKKPWWRRPFE
jgi:hypothetical protein